MLEVAVGSTVSVNLNGKVVELPVVAGSEGEKGLDISNLLKESGYITLDPGYGNTGACKSAICFIDGDQGILRYWGIPIEQLAEQSNFIETSYLLFYGKLPSQKELDLFAKKIAQQYSLPDLIKKLYDGFLPQTHPMAMLASVVSALSGYDSHHSSLEQSEEEVNQTAINLIGKFPAIVAAIYRKAIGKKIVEPDPKIPYTENLLRMMFAGTKLESRITPESVHALDMLLILHADHEQNCSTSAVQLVGSSRTNLYASIAAGIAALWGPWHGGANQDVMVMLQKIQDSGGDVKKYVEIAKDKKANIRLSGFGHRVYKTFDPRAKVIKGVCDKVLDKMGVNDPLLEIAKELEQTALKDDYFIKRKLYPNVDFYSGIIYKAIGIPTDMFTVMFAMGRLPGWVSHWKEMLSDKSSKINRPRQIYVGPTKTDYTPISRRI